MKIKRSELPRLQKEQLHVMDVLHRLCEQNSIRYYIIGGTALGSVRHKGFIPWDVDIDVAMPREDYMRFQKVAEAQSPNGYSFVDFKTDVCCHTSHGFFVYKSDDVSAVGGGSKYGIFIDIFPLDTAPNSVKEQKKHASHIKRLRFWQVYFYRANAKTGKQTTIKLIVKPALRLLQKIYPLNRLNQYIESIMMKYHNLKDEKYWCSMCSHYSYSKQCMEKDIYGAPTLYKFEDRQYYGPEKIEKYLELLFGDYMKLPSKEEQNKYFEE